MSFFSWLFQKLAIPTEESKAAMKPVPAPPLPHPEHQLSSDTRVLPRGIRLNNPGNIERRADDWEGMSTLQDDPRFIRFELPQDGLRALMRILVRYQEKYDLRTIPAILGRFAPSTENNTWSYVVNVAQHIKYSPAAGLPDFATDPALLTRFAEAIILHENGPPYKGYPEFWYETGVYAAALNSALA